MIRRAHGLRRTVRWATSLLVAGVVRVHAQSCSVTGAAGSCAIPITLASPATITYPGIVRVSALPGTTTVTITADDYDRVPSGFVAFTGPTFTVSANRSWSLSVNATASTWAASRPLSRATKPVGDLTWSTNASGVFRPMTTAPVALASGSATEASATTLFFHAALDWTADPPGAYTLTVRVTVTTP